MNPVDIDIPPPEGWITDTFARNQPEYRSLPALVKLDDAEGRIITRWRPSAEELAKLLAGDDLYLEVLTFHHKLQPVVIGVWSDRVACVDGSVE